MVVFRSHDGSAEGDSLRVLQAAGDSDLKPRCFFVPTCLWFAETDEYQTAKAEGGSNVARGVVLTGAGNLTHQQHILHLHMSDNIPKFRETILTALRLAEKKKLKSISFPPLPQEFDTKERRNMLLETFTEFTEVDHPDFLHFIQLSQCADLFRELVHDNPSSAKSRTSATSSPSMKICSSQLPRKVETDPAGYKNMCVLTHDPRSSKTESSSPLERACNASDAKKDSKRIESIDAYMSIEKNKSKQVHIQVLEGDITTENTQAGVVFRSQDGRAKAVDSVRLLLAAGDGIKTEYQAAKAQGGKHVRRGVVLTGAGNLAHQQHILHLHMTDSIPEFRETIFTALKLVEKKELKSISFPSLPCEFDTEERRGILFETFRLFTEVDRPICLHFIQQVTLHDHYERLKKTLVAARCKSCRWAHVAYE